MNKFMQRIFSAQENGEDPILDQLESDIQLAKDLGKLDTDEYKMTVDPVGSVLIHDKVNNELTKATEIDGAGIKLVEIPIEKDTSDLTLGGPVVWIDNSGNRNIGKLVEINDNLSKVEYNGKILTVKTDLIHSMDGVNKKFSSTRDRSYLVDKNGNIMAFGLRQSLGKLHKDNPDWKFMDQYDFNAYKNKLQKKFSNLSEDNQKLFTRQNRRFVLVDKSGKRQLTVDIDNVKGLLQKNPGWTAIKETVYNRNIQKNYSNMSSSVINTIIKMGSLRAAKNK